MASLDFNGEEIHTKKFNTTYELTDIFSLDLERLVVSRGITCNKSDVRYVIGYKTENDRVIPLYIKSPVSCFSNGVTRYNEKSSWKMGLDISEDKEWMNRYIRLWNEIQELLFARLERFIKNDAYINPKLITWNDEFKTNFHGAEIPFNCSVSATAILKIGSVYMQGGKYYPQVFVKECQIVKKSTLAKSFLVGFEASPEE